MKKQIVLLVIMAISFSLSAQMIVLRPLSKPEDAIYGISQKMVFETIINSNLKQKELIKKTKDIFIANRLLDPKKVKLDEISNSQSEFTLPFGFRQGLFNGKNSFGIKTIKPATYLFFDAIFSFNSNGQVKITITNFVEEPFLPLNKKGLYGLDNDNDTRYTDYLGMIAVESMTKSLIGKVLILANGGIDNFATTIQDMNKTLDDQFSVMDKMQANGAGKWITDIKLQIDNFSLYLVGSPEKTMQNLAKERIDKGYLLIVDNQRWNEHFREVLISTFSEVAKTINGSILGIAQDGKMLFENVNGKVLPTDPKERKKWEKEGKSL